MSVHFFFFRYLSLLLFLLDTRASFGINCYYHVVCDQLARAFCDRLTWARMFHLNLNGIWLFGWIESSTHIHKVTQLHSHTETGAHMPGLLVAVTVNKLHIYMHSARCRPLPPPTSSSQSENNSRQQSMCYSTDWSPKNGTQTHRHNFDVSGAASVAIPTNLSER